MKRAALIGAAAASSAVNAEWFEGRSSSNEQKWEPARATVSSSEYTGSLGWTPRPTPGPAEAALRRELLKRGGTSTCAYFQGNTSPSAAIVCTSGAQCIVNDSNRAMGCCSSSNIQACNIATFCVDSTDAQSITTPAAPYTLLCQASTAPSCIMYTYASDSPYSGYRAFSCGTKPGVLTVAYTAPGSPSTGITSASGATTTTAQNSLPSEGGGNAPPITISSSSSPTNTRSSTASANPTSAGSPTSTSTTTAAGGGVGGGSTSSPSSAPSNENSSNNTPTILAGVIGGVGGLVIILTGILSFIFYTRKKRKEGNDPKNRPPIEKVKRPYMPPAFPNSFDYIAAYREARMSRRQSGRPPSGMSFRRQSFVRSMRRRSSMLPFWRQSQHQQQQQQQQQQQNQLLQNQQPQGQLQRQLSQRTAGAAPPRRSGDLKRINSSRFPQPPIPGPPPRTVRDVRQDEFDFGPRPSPTFSIPVNRNNRGIGPVPAKAASTLGRPPITRLDSDSGSNIDRVSSMSVEVSPQHRGGGGEASGTSRAGVGHKFRGGEIETGVIGGLRFSNTGTNDEPASAHTDFDSRFTPPFIHSPMSAHWRPGDIGIATVLAPTSAAVANSSGAGGGGNDRIISTTGATAGSMSNKHDSHALPSPRSPRSPRAPQQYMLYNPKYGPPKETPAKRPVGHLNKMQ
ncbi:hypothetical protein PG990_000301 [Apiospora arundinis]